MRALATRPFCHRVQQTVYESVRRRPPVGPPNGGQDPASAEVEKPLANSIAGAAGVVHAPASTTAPAPEHVPESKSVTCAVHASPWGAPQEQVHPRESPASPM